MSDTKWTPGPWTYDSTDYPGLEDTVVGQMGRIMQADYRELTICQLCDFPEPELFANAHLVAAAPELYEALNNILNSTHPDVRLQPDHLADAYKACAKARGQS